MTSNTLRYTGFSDCLGNRIFEGDYIAVDFNDYPDSIIEQRELRPFILKFSIRYMQVYLIPTNEMTYSLVVYFIDEHFRPLTSVEYYFATETTTEPTTFKEFSDDFSKDFSVEEANSPHSLTVIYSHSSLSAFINEKVWKKLEKPLFPVTDKDKAYSQYNPSFKSGQNYLFTVPDSIYKNKNDMFYSSVIGKELNKLKTCHMQIKINENEFLSLSYTYCFLKEDKTPFSVKEVITLLEFSEASLKYEKINPAIDDLSKPYIGKSGHDCLRFMHYLSVKGGLTLEETPTYIL